MITAIVCPSCGSQDHYQSSSNPKKRMCESCGRVYYTDQLETVKDIQEEKVHPPVSPTTEEQPTEDTSDNGYSGIINIILILVMLVLVGGFFFWIYQGVRRDPEISTIGQYEVLPVDCDAGAVVVEYGFDGEGPLLTVYPERKGENIWIISPQIEEEIKMRLAAEFDYLWIHCDTENKPEYFVYSFPLPINGMEVVLKD